jgi:hypothetical protein
MLYSIARLASGPRMLSSIARLTSAPGDGSKSVYHRYLSTLADF